jgi:hypothetical protein
MQQYKAPAKGEPRSRCKGNTAEFSLPDPGRPGCRKSTRQAVGIGPYYRSGAAYRLQERHISVNQCLDKGKAIWAVCAPVATQ